MSDLRTVSAQNARHVRARATALKKGQVPPSGDPIADAINHLRRVRDAEESFLGYCTLMHPVFEWPDFHLELIDTLDRLEKGTLTNARGDKINSIIINWPPRHGKSWIATTLFTSYYMGRGPARHTLLTAYGADLATTFGQNIRGYMERPEHAQAFPDFAIRPDTRAKHDWHTTEGGRFFATGIGGSTTGRPANLLMIDDPIKNRQEAESPLVRSRVWDFYVTSLENRKEPSFYGEPPIEVIILTRWHPDDLCGRIMALEDYQDGQWLHLRRPAISVKIVAPQDRELVRRDKLPEDDPNYLPTVEVEALPEADQTVPTSGIPTECALWPAQASLEDLKRRRRLNERDFEALYQQRPTIKGGNLIKATWWQWYDETPGTPIIIMAADTAFKKKETADYTAIVTLGLSHQGDIYVLDIVRGRFEFPELKRLMIRMNARLRGNGLRGIYIEDKASGQSLIQELKTESGLSVIPYKVVHDKVARANAVLPLIEGGRVFLPKEAPWLDAFLTETEQFPDGAHDDQVDALVIGLDAISRINLSHANAISGPSLASLYRSSPLETATFRGWGE